MKNDQILRLIEAGLTRADLVTLGILTDPAPAPAPTPAPAPAPTPAPAPAPTPAPAPAPAPAPPHTEENDTGKVLYNSTGQQIPDAMISILGQMQQTLADMAQRNVYSSQMVKPMDSGTAIANFINPPKNDEGV